MIRGRSRQPGEEKRETSRGRHSSRDRFASGNRLPVVAWGSLRSLDHRTPSPTDWYEMWSTNSPSYGFRVGDILDVDNDGMNELLVADQFWGRLDLYSYNGVGFEVEATGAIALRSTPNSTQLLATSTETERQKSCTSANPPRTSSCKNTRGGCTQLLDQCHCHQISWVVVTSCLWTTWRRVT